ncbi:MAG: hypothetical protein GOV15_01235, partial [Candidatus Diapherotrites archaeon]|nr:hypothetical protein [Candidatus Diapherotrites archaeon]
YSAVNSVVPTLAVIPFVFVGLMFFNHFFKAGKGASWIISTLFSSFLTVLLAVLLAFFVPTLIFPTSLSSPSDGIILEGGVPDTLLALVSDLTKVVLKAGLLTFLIMPFIFIGDYIYSKVRGKVTKKKNVVKEWASILAALYFNVFFFVALTYWFEWIIPTLTYLVFYL